MALGQSLRRAVWAGSGLVIGLAALCTPAYVLAAAGAYGDGSYGSCEYNTCGIALITSGTVNLNTTPASGTTCSVQKDAVQVTTDSSTGYTLKIADSDTINQMNGSNGGTVSATGGSYASPTTLTANSWGYRVDGSGSFGAGPTTAVSNGGIPARTFAAVPISSATANTIVTSAAPANPAITTNVWYGLCAASSLRSGTYTAGVTYTALVN